MTHNITQANYKQLETVARTFADEAQRAARVHQRLSDITHKLRRSWLADAADAFFADVNANVLPGVARLTGAYHAAARTTGEIVALLRAAEEEAAAQLKGDAPGVSAATPTPTTGGTMNGAAPLPFGAPAEGLPEGAMPKITPTMSQDDDGEGDGEGEDTTGTRQPTPLVPQPTEPPVLGPADGNEVQGFRDSLTGQRDGLILVFQDLVEALALSLGFRESIEIIFFGDLPDYVADVYTHLSTALSGRPVTALEVLEIVLATPGAVEGAEGLLSPSLNGFAAGGFLVLVEEGIDEWAEGVAGEEIPVLETDIDGGQQEITSVLEYEVTQGELAEPREIIEEVNTVIGAVDAYIASDNYNPDALIVVEPHNANPLAVDTEPHDIGDAEEELVTVWAVDPATGERYEIFTGGVEPETIQVLQNADTAASS